MKGRIGEYMFDLVRFRATLLKEDVFPPAQVEGLCRAMAQAFGLSMEDAYRPDDHEAQAEAHPH